MTQGGSLEWRQVVDKHTAAMVDELNRRLDSDREEIRAQAEAAATALTTERERRSAAAQIELARQSTTRSTQLATAESLNQSLRRIRQAPTEKATLEVLLKSTATLAGQAVVVAVEDNQARLITGPSGESSELAFPLQSAPALVDVTESREPTVALASETELSSELLSVFSTFSMPSTPPHAKAYLFPVVARQKVVAVLIIVAEPDTADFVPPAMELLSEGAGLKLETLISETAPMESLKPLPGSELIQIGAPAVANTTAEQPKHAWDGLSSEDQKLHLQAQRVARVKVAEMRLYHPEQLRKGVTERNIYGALNSEIDRARADFLQTFLSKSRTMVDYLHIEIIRSLAHEDDSLLGAEYPGPMV